MIVTIGIVRSVGVVVRRTWAGRTQFRVLATDREDVVDHYQAQPYRWHRAHPTGELIAHAGVDAEAATEVLAPIPYSLGTVILIVTSAIWMLATDAVLGAAGPGAVPGADPAERGLPAQGRHPGQRGPGAAGRAVGARPREPRGGHGHQGLRRRGARGRSGCTSGPRRYGPRRYGWPACGPRSTCSWTPCRPSPTCCWSSSAPPASTPARRRSATSRASSYLFTLLVWPLRIIGFALGDLPHSLAGWDRVQGTLRDGVHRSAPAPVADLADAHGPGRGGARKVSFAYEPGRDVLRDVDLEIAAGTTVAIVGPTAFGQVDPAGRPGRPVRARLGPGGSGDARGPALVFQEPFLFADTLRRNIDVHGTATDDELQMALDLAQVTPFLAELPLRRRDGRGRARASASRAGSGSGWPSPGPCSTGRRCCSSTTPPPASTPPPRPASSPVWAPAWPASRRSRWPTGPRRSRWPTRWSTWWRAGSMAHGRHEELLATIPSYRTWSRPTSGTAAAVRRSGRRRGPTETRPMTGRGRRHAAVGRGRDRAAGLAGQPRAPPRRRAHRRAGLLRHRRPAGRAHPHPAGHRQGLRQRPGRHGRIVMLCTIAAVLHHGRRSWPCGAPSSGWPSGPRRRSTACACRSSTTSSPWTWPTTRRSGGARWSPGSPRTSRRSASSSPGAASPGCSTGR